MEPITLILTALVAGATAAAKDTAGNAIKDSYTGLKALIKKKFADKDKADSSAILDKYEQKPEKTRPLLEDELIEAEADKDQNIIQLAQAILEQEDPKGTKEGKYSNIVGRDMKVGIQGNVSGGKVDQTIN